MARMPRPYPQLGPTEDLGPADQALDQIHALHVHDATKSAFFLAFDALMLRDSDVTQTGVIHSDSWQLQRA